MKTTFEEVYRTYSWRLYSTKEQQMHSKYVGSCVQ